MRYEKYTPYKAAKRYSAEGKVKAILSAGSEPARSKKAKELVTRLVSLEPDKNTRLIPDSQINPKAAQSAAKAVTNQTKAAEIAKTAQDGNALVDTARAYLGTPYVWGGASPKGFDCSGLMQYTYGKNGISIPRTAREQYKAGTSVSKESLRPGDLVFFKGAKGSAESPGHVGMYIGNGQYIQAPKTGDVVKISNLSGRNDYVGARRYK